MPSRYSQLDTDEERLPEGMVRIGYDADEQVYSYRDTRDGSIWEGPAGARYGRLTKVSNGAAALTSVTTGTGHGEDDERRQQHSAEDTQPFLGGAARAGRTQAQMYDGTKSWRVEMRPLLNFFIIIGLFLIGVVWYLRVAQRGREVAASQCDNDATAHHIKAGESCWAIAKMYSASLDGLRDANEGINCDALVIGQVVCIPPATI